MAGQASSSSFQSAVTAVQNLVQSINNASQTIGKTLRNIKPSILIGNPTTSDGTLQPITLSENLQFTGSELDIDAAAVAAAIEGLLPQPFPPGMINEFAMETPPSGWLVCNGSAVSRTTYANLFAAIGTIWGPGDGSTTFNLPPLQGTFLRSWDNGAGIDPGRAFASLQADAFKSHTHTVTDPGHNHGVNDPGHDHSLSDPGHHHTIGNWSNTGGGQPTLLNQGEITNTPTSTSTSTTGITISGNFTGITNQSSTTGITNASTGGTETRPKNYAVLICIRT